MRTVLVADDDENARLLVRTVLTYAGYRVTEAATGAQALTRVEADDPDLVLLDLSLPDTTGPELLRALRAPGNPRRFRVALYTATPMNPALRDFMEAYDIIAAIPKPSGPAELIGAIEEAFARP
jgi:CheY-like chemotaxis protein